MQRTLLSLAAALALAPAAQAAEPDDSMVAYVNGKVRVWFLDAALQQAIVASNVQHQGMSEAEILALDTLWRAEVGSSDAPTITPVVESPASAILRGHVDDSGGVISEIILMDNRGMNVAVSSVTSDFWQGDEAKYLETFPKGADAMHVGEIELDESSQTYQAQVSFVVTDAAGTPVGAVTVGLNAEAF